jgi:alpha-galactosidase
MLSRGEFLDLYTYGYDSPEAYVIQKDGDMYYAFYTEKDKHWDGDIELRGLAPGKHRVFDYENGHELGFVQGESPKLKVEFTNHLLLEVSALH